MLFRSYVAIRYPPRIQRRIDQGQTFHAFAKNPPLDRPYLTRNDHLGHHASLENPNYFEADQLYNLKLDPEENQNVIEKHPEVAVRMKQELSVALRQFPDRPFGEFTSPKTIIQQDKQ